MGPTLASPVPGFCGHPWPRGGLIGSLRMLRGSAAWGRDRHGPSVRSRLPRDNLPREVGPVQEVARPCFQIHMAVAVPSPRRLRGWPTRSRPSTGDHGMTPAATSAWPLPRCRPAAAGSRAAHSWGTSGFRSRSTRNFRQISASWPWRCSYGASTSTAVCSALTGSGSTGQPLAVEILLVPADRTRIA